MKQLIIFVFATTSLWAQSELKHIDPPFWWAGMANPALQLMLHGDDIGHSAVKLDNPNIIVKSVTTLENPNYLILDLDLTHAGAGTFDVTLTKGRKTQKFTYELKERESGSAMRDSYTPADVLYLITPDRFANGNPDNDQFPDMADKLNRQDNYGRHGGDIQGIVDHLDYLKDLGFTAIWVNPVLENDMPNSSYHGYATTDFYKVDPRFGTNEEYRQLSEKAHERGIKVIMDMIVNHCGSEHWWMKDLPASDWFNYQEEYLEEGNYVNTTHRKTIIQDPHGAKADLREFEEGWFVPTMPDMNQRNPFVATYLIQNAIWWVEYAGIDGIRMDTYPYADRYFIADWTCALRAEYPKLMTVGEEYVDKPAIVAYWQEGKVSPDGYRSCLPSLLDFPIQARLVDALNEPVGNWSGWVKAYEALAMDFLYANPYDFVIFPDNHDMSRILKQVNDNVDLFNLAIAYMTTMRGIPQFYYGTEILMTHETPGDHGEIRADYPGGWEGDEVNAFTGDGLTDAQKATQEYFRTLLNWRKTSAAVHYGKIMHYNPKDGIYVYFRYTDDDKVMTVLSKNKEDVTLDLSRFYEMIEGTESGKEVITGKALKFDGFLTVPAMAPMIIDLD